MKAVRYLKHNLGNCIRFFYQLYLRSVGVQIGSKTMISLGAKIDVRRGTIMIGKNCHITHGCVILSHDGSAKQIDPKSKGEGRVVIGNNVFVGVNSVVLPDVKIGDNSVIGAGSVVTKDIPPNCVAAGNPAKILRRLKS